MTGSAKQLAFAEFCQEPLHGNHGHALESQFLLAALPMIELQLLCRSTPSALTS